MQTTAVKKPFKTAIPQAKTAQTTTITQNFTNETGLYYYGARYLDPKTSRWLSGDPALGEYVPQAGKGSDGLPGMGGVFNTVNLHTYHYAGNNPVKYTDPTGLNSEEAGEIDIYKRNIWPNAPHLEIGFYNKDTNEYTITGVNIKAGPERYIAYADSKDITITGNKISSNYSSADGLTDGIIKENSVAFSITMQMSPKEVAEFRAAMISERTEIGAKSNIGFGFNFIDIYSASADEVSRMKEASMNATTSYAPKSISNYNVLLNSCVTHVRRTLSASTMSTSLLQPGPWGFADDTVINNIFRWRGRNRL
jgi:RHS repeat-associated protein